MEIKQIIGTQRSLFSAGLLIVLYFVGITAILIEFHPDFILLTPINLLISLGLMLWNHPVWTKRIIAFLILAYCWGMTAEMIGVHTGLLFGGYEYGQVLGPKVAETPLMIGINWVLLSYSGGICLNYLAPKIHWVSKGILAALLLVGLDLLIEPVAIQYDLWRWDAGWPPVRNYIGWFLVALPLQLGFARFFGKIQNIVAVILFILQITFFAIIGLLASST